MWVQKGGSVQIETQILKFTENTKATIGYYLQYNSRQKVRNNNR